jgi:pyruvate dehydrogenase E2 component (dihydrolipoamide acetyltransferase)
LAANTVTAILLKVVASSQGPSQLNASLDVANHEIIYKKYIHMGVAVDTEHGLAGTMIHNVDKKNVLEIAVELSIFPREPGQAQDRRDERQFHGDKPQG